MNKASCGHAEYAEGHCAHMECRNYINKCPVHSISNRPGICTLDKIGEGD